MTIEKKISIRHLTNRKDLRAFLLNIFAEEDAGTGTGDLASRYWYIAEELSDGTRIILKRPGTINNGIDFAIWVEKVRFRTKKGKERYMPPSLQNILDDLRIKKVENPTLYRQLLVEIENIYNLRPFNFNSLRFSNGLPPETLLNIVKWFFVEQDMTYWNKTGRAMYMGKIMEV